MKCTWCPPGCSVRSAVGSGTLVAALFAHAEGAQIEVKQNALPTAVPDADAACISDAGDCHHQGPLQAWPDRNAGARGRAYRGPQLPHRCATSGLWLGISTGVLCMPVLSQLWSQEDASGMCAGFAVRAVIRPCNDSSPDGCPACLRPQDVRGKLAGLDTVRSHCQRPVCGGLVHHDKGVLCRVPVEGEGHRQHQVSQQLSCKSEYWLAVSCG